MKGRYAVLNVKVLRCSSFIRCWNVLDVWSVIFRCSSPIRAFPAHQESEPVVQLLPSCHRRPRSPLASASSSSSSASMPSTPHSPLCGCRGVRVRVRAAVPGCIQQGGVELSGQGCPAEERFRSLASLQTLVEAVSQGTTEQTEPEGGRNTLNKCVFFLIFSYDRVQW